MGGKFVVRERILFLENKDFAPDRTGGSFLDDERLGSYHHLMRSVICFLRFMNLGSV